MEKNTAIIVTSVVTYRQHTVVINRRMFIYLRERINTIASEIELVGDSEEAITKWN